MGHNLIRYPRSRYYPVPTLDQLRKRAHRWLKHGHIGDTCSTSKQVVVGPFALRSDVPKAVRELEGQTIYVRDLAPMLGVTIKTCLWRMKRWPRERWFEANHQQLRGRPGRSNAHYAARRASGGAIETDDESALEQEEQL